jgi:hypothetical protein
MSDPLYDELRIARALRKSLLDEREALTALTPEQRDRALASAESILDLLEKIAQLELARAAIVKAMRSANSESISTTLRRH